MLIDSLTYGELKQIAALFNSASAASPAPHPFVGKYVIARCYAAGVHAGEVVSVDVENVVLKDSRRLWSWKAKEGVALSGVAQNGLQPGGKVDVLNPLIALTGVCELIPCSAAAKGTIDAAK
jgi:integrase